MNHRLAGDGIIVNTPFDELTIGAKAELTRLCREEDIFVFANASGNHNPAHLPNADHDGDGVVDAPLAPSLWVASLVSAVLGNQMPGPGTLYKSQTLSFLGHARVGDELIARVRLTEKGENRLAVFDTTVETSDGLPILAGTAQVIAPEFPVSYDRTGLPALTVRRHAHFDRLLARAEPLEPIRTAVVVPESGDSLAGALLAARHTLITPILVGDRERIMRTAAAIGADLSGIRIEQADDPDAAAARSVAMVHDGLVDALMKGHLHTDELLRHVVKRDGGLRTARRLSHAFVMDVPGLDHLLTISDAAINIAPDLDAKIDIIQNAIELATAMGVYMPRVAVLSAVETVNPKIPSTVDAAALSKMAERGQITGGFVDGPLAMDNAVSEEAARAKGIRSTVAGTADILICPDLESGNMIAKQLTFLAHAEAGGIVLGARCPIILNSRSDNDQARLASCAIAALHHNRAARPR